MKRKLLLFILLCTVLMGCAQEPSKTPSQVVEDYWQAIKTGDKEQASELWEPRGSKKGVGVVVGGLIVGAIFSLLVIGLGGGLIIWIILKLMNVSEPGKWIGGFLVILIIVLLLQSIGNFVSFLGKIRILRDQLHSLNAEYIKDSKIEVLSEDISGDTAVVSFRRTHLPSNETEEGGAELYLKDGRWKISSWRGIRWKLDRGLEKIIKEEIGKIIKEEIGEKSF